MMSQICEIIQDSAEVFPRFSRGNAQVSRDPLPRPEFSLLSPILMNRVICRKGLVNDICRA
jgi:hypothetical protein